LSYKSPKTKMHKVINEYIFDHFLIEEEKKKLNELFIFINNFVHFSFRRFIRQ